MTRGNRSLEMIRPGRDIEIIRTLESSKSSTNEKLIPTGSVLVEKQHRITCWPNARSRSRSLNLHESNESMHFGFTRCQLRENSPNAQCVLAQRRTNDVIATRRRVSLVENQIDDLEH